LTKQRKRPAWFRAGKAPEGLFVGLKLAGLCPAKWLAKSPTKTISPQKSKLALTKSFLLASAIFAPACGTVLLPTGPLGYKTRETRKE